jgi:hypothetical protein
MSNPPSTPHSKGHSDGKTIVDTNNRFGVDFRGESRRLGPPPCPIIDFHAHIGGDRAAMLYREAADLYGVEQVFSMTPFDELPRVREIMGDRVQFIAVPNWYAEDRKHALGAGFLDQIGRFHAEGSRIIKFFQAPRIRDVEREFGEPGLLRLDGPLKLEAARLAEELGMAIMTHVADPDTWFKCKYADAELYGTKAEQYEPLERMLDQFGVPWIGAHLGGSPEDLDHLDGLLERHENLHLDTSACKWMIRELGAKETPDVIGFFTKWRSRLLFGSDIVSMEAHLEPSTEENVMAAKASGEEQAFDLYASRYWSLRMMYEGTGMFESPIVDPDLHMVDPDTHSDTDAPTVRCHGFDESLLESLYRGTAQTLKRTLGLDDALSIRS